MKRILIFGGRGMVGSKFISLNSQNFNINAPLASEIDILKKDQINKTVQRFNPDAVINFAAFTQVEEAEKQKADKNGICYQVNAIGAQNIAESCHNFNKHLIHISTEYVFDGTKSASPYTEDDQPNPINWYGQTKHLGEQFVLESGCPAAIARICMPYSAYYEVKLDIARLFLNKLKEKEVINAVSDQQITPTLVDDIAAALVALINNQATGVYHISVSDFTTPFKFAMMLATEFGLNTSLIKTITFDDYNKNKQARLLKNSWLDSTKFRQKFGENILHKIVENVKIFKEQLTKSS